MPVSDSESESTEDLVGRLFTIWGAARGYYTAVPEHGAPTAEHVRDLGQYLGEALFDTGQTASALAEGMDQRQRTAMAQGISLEWFNIVRASPEHALATLAFLTEVLHAAIDGTRASGHDNLDDAYQYAAKLRGCLDDAHRYVIKLQEQLAVSAAASGVVEAALQILAEENGTDR